eukprot:gene13415-9230_t
MDGGRNRHYGEQVRLNESYSSLTPLRVHNEAERMEAACWILFEFIRILLFLTLCTLPPPPSVCSPGLMMNKRPAMQQLYFTQRFNFERCPADLIALPPSLSLTFWFFFCCAATHQTIEDRLLLFVIRIIDTWHSLRPLLSLIFLNWNMPLRTYGGSSKGLTLAAETLPDVPLPDGVTRWNSDALDDLHRRVRSGKFPADVPLQQALFKTLDILGLRSQIAQGINAPLTSVSKMRENREYRVYLLVQGHKGVGILKIGTKKLFVTHPQTKSLVEIDPLCVLDFYVSDDKQRQGLGQRLYAHMLQQEGTQPELLAIDRPSPKFLGFMSKYYRLEAFTPEVNNFVVFHRFFDGTAITERGQLRRLRPPASATERVNRSGPAKGKDEAAPYTVHYLKGSPGAALADPPLDLQTQLSSPVPDPQLQPSKPNGDNDDVEEELRRRIAKEEAELSRFEEALRRGRDVSAGVFNGAHSDNDVDPAAALQAAAATKREEVGTKTNSGTEPDPVDPFFLETEPALASRSHDRSPAPQPTSSLVPPVGGAHPPGISFPLPPPLPRLLPRLQDEEDYPGAGLHVPLPVVPVAPSPPATSTERLQPQLYGVPHPGHGSPLLVDTSPAVPPSQVPPPVAGELRDNTYSSPLAASALDRDPPKPENVLLGGQAGKQQPRARGTRRRGAGEEAAAPSTEKLLENYDSALRKMELLQQLRGRTEVETPPLAKAALAPSPAAPLGKRKTKVQLSEQPTPQPTTPPQTALSEMASNTPRALFMCDGTPSTLGQARGLHYSDLVRERQQQQLRQMLTTRDPEYERAARQLLDPLAPSMKTAMAGSRGSTTSFQSTFLRRRSRRTKEQRRAVWDPYSTANQAPLIIPFATRHGLLRHRPLEGQRQVALPLQLTMPTPTLSPPTTSNAGGPLSLYPSYCYPMIHENSIQHSSAPRQQRGIQYSKLSGSMKMQGQEVSSQDGCRSATLRPCERLRVMVVMGPVASQCGAGHTSMAPLPAARGLELWTGGDGPSHFSVCSAAAFFLQIINVIVFILSLSFCAVWVWALYRSNGDQPNNHLLPLCSQVVWEPASPLPRSGLSTDFPTAMNASHRANISFRRMPCGAFTHLQETSVFFLFVFLPSPLANLHSLPSLNNCAVARVRPAVSRDSTAQMKKWLCSSSSSRLMLFFFVIGIFLVGCARHDMNGSSNGAGDD